MPEGKKQEVFLLLIFFLTDCFTFIGFMIWGIFDNKAELQGVNFITLIYFAPGSERVETFIFVSVSTTHTPTMGTCKKSHTSEEKFYFIPCLLNLWGSVFLN